MADNVISAVLALVGVLFGSLTTWLCSRDSRKMERLKEENTLLKRYLCIMGDQIKSYWRLEKKYAQDLAAEKDGNKRTFLIEYRKQIVNEGGEKPYMTADEVDKILKRCDAN